MMRNANGEGSIYQEHEVTDGPPRDEEREAIEAAAKRKAAELGPVSAETMRTVAQIMAPALNKLYGRSQQESQRLD